MPMYYPDFSSVREECERMSTRQKEENKYRGIIPKDESELPRARIELGRYFREVWKDEIQAIEVEQSATEENYREAIARGIFHKIFLTAQTDGVLQTLSAKWLPGATPALKEYHRHRSEKLPSRPPVI